MNKRVLIGVIAVLVAGCFAPRPAEAGTYPVVACLADSSKFRTHAFSDYATRGMRIRRACGSRVRRSRGIFAGNVVRRGSVPRNSRALMTLRAPAGMRFSSLNWTGSARRSDCRYEIEMAAIGPGVAERLTKVVAGKKCPKRGRAQVAGRRQRGDGPRNIRGADRIVLRTICKAKRGTRCSSRRANYASFGVVSATVEDVEPPTVSITGGDLVSGRWVRGEQPITYTASDRAGVQTAASRSQGAATRGEGRTRATTRVRCHVRAALTSLSSRAPDGFATGPTKRPWSWPRTRPETPERRLPLSRGWITRPAAGAGDGTGWRGLAIVEQLRRDVVESPRG